MPPQNDFVLFGTAHLTAIGAIFAVALALPLAVRFLAPDARRPAAYFLATVLLLQECIRIWMQVDAWGFSVHLLPFQLCTLAVYVNAWMLFAQDSRAFELVYYWGLGGTTQALLTPDVEAGFPAVSSLLFFLGHGTVIVSVFYAMIVLRFRPTLHALPRVMAITAGAAAVALAVNLLLDTNFMYLMAKPARPSLLDWFGPWPWYLPGLVVVGLLSFVLLYLPFFIADRVNRKVRCYDTG